MAMWPLVTRLMGGHLELRVELCPETAMILADQHQLEQVIVNLVLNAGDAMPGGGLIHIETGRVELERDLRLAPGGSNRPIRHSGSHCDTGVGMDEATRQHIFDPFFTTKTIGKGTGLGLSMVLGIVQQSGGYMDVSSELGRGTTFRIYLPMVVEAA